MIYAKYLYKETVAKLSGAASGLPRLPKNGAASNGGSGMNQILRNGITLTGNITRTPYEFNRHYNSVSVSG
jgi:hypothetical protein